MIEIPLTKGYSTIIDDHNADLAQFKWYASVEKTRVYAKRRMNGKIVALAAIILSRKLGRSLERLERADHINNLDTLDNRESNLRLATVSQNNHNQRRKANNTSGYKGVSWYKAGRKWRADISVNGKSIFLGYYVDKEDARKAYVEAAQKLHHDFANSG